MKFTPNILRFLIIALLVLGIFFRFANLDQKIYWHDETYTSLRLSGYSLKELTQGVFTGEVISIEELHKYQRINSERGVVDTVKRLAEEDPQHPPLYYAMARLWVQGFGDSITGIRSLSAVISLLIFPSAYWLCRELFKSSLTAWIAVALIALSPFHVLYAQEARQYSLWTVTILLSSAALLRAIKCQTKQSWIIYGVTLSLALYSHSISLLVVLAYGVYVFLIEGFRLSRNLMAYWVSTLLAVLSFVPWLINLRNTNGVSWTAKEVSGSFLVKNWLGDLTRIFFDFQKVDNPLIIVAPPVLILIGYSVYFLVKKLDRKIWLFLLALGGIPLLLLLLPDLIFGGRRTTVNRYLIPTYLSVQLAVGYLLSTKITSIHLFQQKFWKVITAMLISIEIISCAINLPQKTAWNKEFSNDNLPIAFIINKKNHPLLISSTDYYLNPGELFSISYLLDAKVKLLLLVEPNTPNIPNDYTDIFLFNTSQVLAKEIEQKYDYNVKRFNQYRGLWHLKK
ncbi:glycosyltransferase family 39 protein [Coleofasciculus sp. G2-EDA-02]|uniref:glycosyltransferase family 39 protein n=1 Tax=Coleofasciculus sp. G2-EDA-02 TaxID=3069529 RepID=UPI0032FF6468